MKFNQNLLKQIGKGIFAFFLFYYSSYFQLIPILLFRIKDLSGATGVLLSFFSNIILVLLLSFLYRKELKQEWKIFRSKPMENLDTGLKWWLIGLFGMMVSNILLNVLFHTGQANNEQAVQSMISSLPWLMVINAGIIAPFIEEIIFRKCFKNVFSSPWVFILTSGFTFGLMHVLTNSTTLADFLFFIPYSCVGLAFAKMYSKTNTVFTSIGMHMLHNTILTLISIL